LEGRCDSSVISGSSAGSGLPALGSSHVATVQPTHFIADSAPPPPTWSPPSASLCLMSSMYVARWQMTQFVLRVIHQMRLKE
jgi:hypothetical protein